MPPAKFAVKVVLSGTAFFRLAPRLPPMRTLPVATFPDRVYVLRHFVLPTFLYTPCPDKFSNKYKMFYGSNALWVPLRQWACTNDLYVCCRFRGSQPGAANGIAMFIR